MTIAELEAEIARLEKVKAETEEQLKLRQVELSTASQSGGMRDPVAERLALRDKQAKANPNPLQKQKR